MRGTAKEALTELELAASSSLNASSTARLVSIELAHEAFYVEALGLCHGHATCVRTERDGRS